MKHAFRAMLLGFTVAALASLPALALTSMENGVHRLDAIDDLLSLKNDTQVRVLLIDQKIEARQVSDAHVQIAREWVRSGGVLWIVEDGLQSPLSQSIAAFVVRDFDYKKASTGKQGGELVVRGVSPRHVIADHILTQGIGELYLFTRYRFDGTDHITPLIVLTDTKGNTGTVIGAIEIGRGMMVLDGTARKRNAVLSRVPGLGLKGFHPDHPNARKDGKAWIEYDWPKMMANAVHHADVQFQARAR